MLEPAGLMNILARVGRAFKKRDIPVPVRVFGVGAAKTGTHSIASLFADSGLAAAHEPNAGELLELVLDRAAGTIDTVAFRRAFTALIARDDIAINVSQINGYVIDDLYAMHPEAKYILTVRDAEGWARSLINHVVTRAYPGSVWERFRHLRFARGFPFRPEERWLEEQNFYSLDSLLDYWQWHTLEVLKTVPAPQLRIVPTLQIADYKRSLYDFLGLASDPREADTHAYRGDYSPDLDRLPAAYIEKRCAFYSDGLIRAARPFLDADNLAILTTAVYPGGANLRERIADTSVLMTNHATDLDRWAHVARETDARWDGRAELAASMIVDQTSVLDLGCGAMALERYLPRSATYIPSDCIRRDVRTIVCDLNRSALPDVEAGCVAALGLFEYIHDVPKLMKALARQFDVMVCSYIPLDTVDSIEVRRSTGWVNDYRIDEFEALLAAAGFAVAAKQKYLDRAWLWRVEKSRDG